MKILYLTTILTPAHDAQSLQVQSMAQSFYNTLLDNFVLISPQTELNKKLKTKFNWIKLPVPNKLRSLRYLFVIICSIKLVLKLRPNVIYSRDIVVIFFYRMLGFRVVYEIHKPFETIFGEVIFRIIRNKIKVVAISSALKDYIIKKYNLSINNVLTVHDGVFLDEYLTDNKDACRIKLRKMINLPDDSFIALYSGNLKVSGKGTDLIFQAAKDLPNVSFVILGGKLDDADLPKNLYFIERQDVKDIPKFLVAADVLLLPFTRELKTYKYHSALKMFEYMASGVPIVASNLGSITEVMNNQNAFLFDCDDPNDLTKNILSIYVDRSAAVSRAQRALEDVQKYDWSKRVQAILKFLSL